MRTDGRDASRFVPRSAMPSIDHEAHGPVSALVQLTAWLGRLWGERADHAQRQLILQSRRWL